MSIGKTNFIFSTGNRIVLCSQLQVIQCTMGQEQATAKTTNTSCFTLSQANDGFFSAVLFVLGCTGLHEAEVCVGVVVSFAIALYFCL